MSHDPTVTAAVIAIAGTAFVAVAGYVTTVRATKHTVESGERTTKAALKSAEANVQATIHGEREHRLWERRTDTYIDVLADTTHRQMVREHHARRFRFNQEAEDAIQNTLDSYKPDSSWFMLEARLRAYATDAVISAFLASNDAHREFIAAAQKIEFAAKGAESVAAFKARDAAVKAAREKDEALGAVIREEIQLMRVSADGAIGEAPTGRRP